MLLFSAGKENIWPVLIQRFLLSFEGSLSDDSEPVDGEESDDDDDVSKEAVPHFIWWRTSFDQIVVWIKHCSIGDILLISAFWTKVKVGHCWWTLSWPDARVTAAAVVTSGLFQDSILHFLNSSLLFFQQLTASLLAVAFLTSFGSSMLYGYNLAVVNSPAGVCLECQESEHFRIFNQTIRPGKDSDICWLADIRIFACFW